MKSYFTIKTLFISAMAMFAVLLSGSCVEQSSNVSGKSNQGIPLFDHTQTNGKNVKVFMSAASQNEMLVAQQDVTFKTDFETENQLICIYPEFTYQEILGFGGAFTEAAAVNFSLLSPAQKDEVTELFFGKTGLGLNLCRTHISSADFGVDEYVYVTDEDVDLKTFSIDRERKDIMPMIKAALKVNPDIWLFGSTWSPPAWMKDNKSVIQGGRLLDEHYPTYANYISRYLEEYKKEGINFFGITIQNEAKAVQTWESCIYTGEEEGIFAVNYLRPTLDKNGLSDIKIMIWDHNKERVMERARESFSVPGAREAIWGIAHHWYSGEHYDNLRMAYELFPDKPMIATENGGGGSIIGAPNYWSSVERWTQETIMNMNNYTGGMVIWNLILNQYGRPHHNRPTSNQPPSGTTGGGPIGVNTETNEFFIKSMYYTLGHFSKYIKRGAVRIGSSSYNDGIKVAAFSNPNGEVVVVVLNTGERDATAPKIRLNNCTADIVLPAKSLQTFIIPPLG